MASKRAAPISKKATLNFFTSGKGGGGGGGGGGLRKAEGEEGIEAGIARGGEGRRQR